MGVLLGCDAGSHALCFRVDALKFKSRRPESCEINIDFLHILHLCFGAPTISQVGDTPTIQGFKTIRLCYFSSVIEQNKGP